VAPKLGAVKGSGNADWQADVTLAAAPSALYDAVIVPPGDVSIASLCGNGLAVEFIKDQYRHCKPILVLDTGADLLDRAELPALLPTGEPDFSRINAAADQLDEALATFVQALAGPRELDRETDPPVV
jgi:catalase